MNTEIVLPGINRQPPAGDHAFSWFSTTEASTAGGEKAVAGGYAAGIDHLGLAFGQHAIFDIDIGFLEFVPRPLYNSASRMAIEKT